MDRFKWYIKYGEWKGILISAKPSFVNEIALNNGEVILIGIDEFKDLEGIAIDGMKNDKLWKIYREYEIRDKEVWESEEFKMHMRKKWDQLDKLDTRIDGYMFDKELKQRLIQIYKRTCYRVHTKVYREHFKEGYISCKLRKEFNMTEGMTRAVNILKLLGKSRKEIESDGNFIELVKKELESVGLLRLQGAEDSVIMHENRGVVVHYVGYNLVDIPTQLVLEDVTERFLRGIQKAK